MEAPNGKTSRRDPDAAHPKAGNAGSMRSAEVIDLDERSAALTSGGGAGEIRSFGTNVPLDTLAARAMLGNGMRLYDGLDGVERLVLQDMK